MLSIYEKLFLLALDEEKGSCLYFAKKTLAHGLAGGILAELAFLGKICSNEKHRLELVDDSSVDDEFLDNALQEIRSSEKLRKLSYWVSQLSSRPKKLRELIGMGLSGKELLVKEERRFFWKTSNGSDSPTRPTTKYEMKEPLRSSILLEVDSDPRDLALLSVASASGLLSLIFTQDEVSIAQHRIHEKIIRGALGNPVMQTIEEIEQAILASMDIDLD
jgi:golgi phosphoprotein 3